MNRLAGSPGRLWGRTAKFNPLSLSPLLWFDAGKGVETTTGVPATNGQLVSIWRDQSGNGNDAVQATTAQQPTLATDGVLFTGLQKNLVSSLNIASLPYNIFLVEKPISLTSGSGRRTLSSGTINAIVAANRGSLTNAAFAGNKVSDYSQNDTNVHVVDLKASVTAGASEYYFDGVNRTTGTPPSMSAWGTFVLGRNAATEPAETYIKEVLVFGDLSDSNRLKVRQYLANKYGITL